MPYSHLNDFPADIRERAKKIRLACFDVDGTLTDGKLIIDSDGNESKSFHVLDGLGLKLIQRKGIAVAFVTARASAAAERRAAELGVESHTGVSDKLQCVEGIAQRLGVSLDEVAFMYAAIDLLADKLDRLLMKHKEKLIDSHRGGEAARGG